jgi:hypothetical protein
MELILGFDVGVAHVQANWGPNFGAGHLISPMEFNGRIAPTSVGKGKNKPEIHFAYGFVVANGATIVAEATKSEIANADGATFAFSARSSWT